MVATVSPAADNYEETLSTLRYADRAKNIVNHAVVNEDPNARIIRELREEVDKLRDQLTQAEVKANGCSSSNASDGFAALSAHLCGNLQSLKAPELKERLEESEKLIQEMTVTWEEKLRKTEEIAQVIRAILLLLAWCEMSVYAAGDSRRVFVSVCRSVRSSWRA